MKKLLVFVLIIAGAGWYYMFSAGLSRAFAAETLREYEVTLTEGSDRVSLTETIPRRTGKVLLVIPATIRCGNFLGASTLMKYEWRSSGTEVDPPRLHDAMYDLDSSIRANTPEEVATVIFCERSNSKVIHKSDSFKSGSYEMWWEWEGGRRRMIDLKVYDLRSKQFLGAYRLVGPVPTKRQAREEEFGDPPDVAAFVATMPVR